MIIDPEFPDQGGSPDTVKPAITIDKQLQDMESKGYPGQALSRFLVEIKIFGNF